jgi:hypothetical protein
MTILKLAEALQLAQSLGKRLLFSIHPIYFLSEVRRDGGHFAFRSDSTSPSIPALVRI